MMSSRGSPEPHSSQYILTPSFITNGMEISGYVTRVWKYDGLTQMNVTIAFSLYIIRFRYAKSRNAVPGGRPHRHDYAQPSRQTQRVDCRHGTRSALRGGRGGAR